MIIKLKLLSDLCILKNDKEKTKNGIIESRILKDRIHKEANNIMEIYNNYKTEYFNYKEIIHKLFEQIETKKYVELEDGICIDKDKKFLMEFEYGEIDNLIFKKGSEFDFNVKIIDDNRYVNFFNICLLALRYLGDYNNVGLGEVNLIMSNG
jgi:hypothetical protein